MTSRTAHDSVELVGRALIALLFIPAGWTKLFAFERTVSYIASRGVPLPEACAAIAIGAELGLGLLLLFGVKVRWVAVGLAIFTAVITPIFHGFWAVPEAQMNVQRLLFTKNLAVVGGLLLIVALGSGRFSFDGWRQGAPSAKGV